jgi:hypothetical protein
MLETKKELVKKYNEGHFKEVAFYNPSAFDVLEIIDIDDYDEYVFGYYQYMDHEKKFFKVKFYWTEHDQRFRVQGKNYYISEFLRSSFIKDIG